MTHHALFYYLSILNVHLCPSWDDLLQSASFDLILYSQHLTQTCRQNHISIAIASAISVCLFDFQALDYFFLLIHCSVCLSVFCFWLHITDDVRFVLLRNGCLFFHNNVFLENMISTPVIFDYWLKSPISNSVEVHTLCLETFDWVIKLNKC